MHMSSQACEKVSWQAILEIPGFIYILLCNEIYVDGFVSEKRNFLQTTLWRNRGWPVDFAALVEVEEACQVLSTILVVRPVVLSTVDYKSVILSTILDS